MAAFSPSLSFSLFHTHAHTHSLSLSVSLSDTHTHTHSHTLSHLDVHVGEELAPVAREARVHGRVQPLSLSVSLSLSVPLSGALSISHTRARALIHTHTRCLSLSLSLALSFSFTPLPQADPPGSSISDFIRTIIYNAYSGSKRIITHVDHTSHCKTASGTNWSKRWTYRVFIKILATIRSSRHSRPRGKGACP